VRGRALIPREENTLLRSRRPYGKRSLEREAERPLRTVKKVFWHFFAGVEAPRAYAAERLCPAKRNLL
jgi:hypothetical protein